MKIGVNTRFLIPNQILEGVGRFSFETIKRMVISHPEHEYYFFFDRPFSKEFIFSNKVKPVVLFPPARHAFLFIIWFEWSVRRILKKEKIDVFLSLDGFLSLNSNVPQIAVIHDLYYSHRPEFIPFINRKYYQYFMPKFIQKASYLLAVSHFVKDDILNQFPQIDEAKVSVTYNALPSHFDNKPSIQKSYLDVPYFLVPGSIHQRKNTLNVLKAFQLFVEESGLEYKIVFVGRFMQKNSEELDGLWKEMAVKKLLVHDDAAEDQDMVNWISYSRALVYVSQFEGFGIPLLEGFECKVPVITSNITSLPEVAADAALKVNPFDIEEIKNAMLLINNDEQLRESLIVKGSKRVTDFNWQDSMNVIYAAIQKVTNKSH